MVFKAGQLKSICFSVGKSYWVHSINKLKKYKVTRTKTHNVCSMFDE